MPIYGLGSLQPNEIAEALEIIDDEALEIIDDLVEISRTRN
jgi:hypothetical protein